MHHSTHSPTLKYRKPCSAVGVNGRMRVISLGLLVAYAVGRLEPSGCRRKAARLMQRLTSMFDHQGVWRPRFGWWWCVSLSRVSPARRCNTRTSRRAAICNGRGSTPVTQARGVAWGGLGAESSCHGALEPFDGQAGRIVSSLKARGQIAGSGTPVKGRARFASPLGSSWPEKLPPAGGRCRALSDRLQCPALALALAMDV